MRFYAKRIPNYNRKKTLLRIIVVLLSVAGSALARYELITLVVMTTAASAAVTSWMEFTDMGSKAQRYTRASSSLRNLLDWWGSLSEVRKASREQIAYLITTSEGIIAEEQIGWTSMAKKEVDNRKELTPTERAARNDLGKSGPRVVPVESNKMS